ncbi:MAG: hypothetical protein SPE05_05255 [Bacteroidales bacterium]|nr:hypothetical protein [Bacteroidales bacterium]
MIKGQGIKIWDMVANWETRFKRKVVEEGYSLKLRKKNTYDALLAIFVGDNLATFIIINICGDGNF